MTTIILLRHAESQQTAWLPRSERWLSKKGQHQSEKLAKIKFIQDVDVLVSSQETKAYKTIEPLAEKLRLPITKIAALNELNRDGMPYLTREEFDSMKKKVFQKMDEEVSNCESASDALRRFKEGIELLEEKYPDKTILVSSHGMILWLYFSDLLGEMSNAYSRRKKIDFCARGITRSGLILKDISGFSKVNNLTKQIIAQWID